MDISQLRPFTGAHTSLITFASGHVFRISDWSATPTTNSRREDAAAVLHLGK